MSRKVDPAKLQAVFGRMMEADPENRFCADCHSKNPRWASTNLGVFICIKCAGIHRSIGTHVTKVKSISLDGWEEAQLAVMRRVGNTNGRRIWEATMPENVRRERPNENASSAVLDHWIRAKYERKLYFSQAAYDEVFNGAPRAATAPAAAPASTGALPPPKSIASAPRRPSGRALVGSTGTPAAAPAPAAAPTSFADSLFGAPVAAPAPTPAPAQPQGRPRAPSGGSAALFGAPVSAAPQQAQQQAQQQPQQRDATADLLFGTGSAGPAPTAAAEPRRDTSAIMALFGTSGAGTAPLQPTPVAAAPASAAMFGGAAPLQPQQQAQQQQRMGQQQAQQRPQGNYDVDLRAYGVYRATTPQQQQQQMTPQMQAYYQQQQMLYQQQQQRYTPNYTRFV